jgi:hypothetical protein
VGLVLVGVLTGESRGNFILWDGQQMTVNTTHSEGSLYDTSRAFIVPGGYVTGLYARDCSTVNICGGSAGTLIAYNASTLNILSGSVYYLYTWGSGSVVNISGGSVDHLDVLADNGTANIYGGWVDGLFTSGVVDVFGGSVYTLCAYPGSVVTFHGRNFDVRGGLWWDGNRVLGTGLLTGEWMDGTPCAVNIHVNESRDEYKATILVVPEPATLALLTLGGLLAFRRRRCK